jgi:hypothetical protein
VQTQERVCEQPDLAQHCERDVHLDQKQRMATLRLVRQRGCRKRRTSEDSRVGPHTLEHEERDAVQCDERSKRERAAGAEHNVDTEVECAREHERGHD